MKQAAFIVRDCWVIIPTCRQSLSSVSPSLKMKDSCSLLPKGLLFCFLSELPELVPSLGPVSVYVPIFCLWLLCTTIRVGRLGTVLSKWAASMFFIETPICLIALHLLVFLKWVSATFCSTQYSCRMTKLNMAWHSGWTLPSFLLLSTSPLVNTLEVSVVAAGEHLRAVLYVFKEYDAPLVFYCLLYEIIQFPTLQIYSYFEPMECPRRVLCKVCSNVDPICVPTTKGFLEKHFMSKAVILHTGY